MPSSREPSDPSRPVDASRPARLPAHADPAAPTPAETRDWTVITRESCAECGFDPATVTAGAVPSRIRATVPRWEAVLTAPGPAGAGRLRDRPAPHTWSPLEYACHVRDVCRTFTARLAQIRDTPAEAGPALFDDWDQNAAQVQGRYNAQDPAEVARAYAAAADTLAEAFARVAADEWSREGMRGDGARFTALSLAAYLIHDLEHHLADAGADRVR